MRHHAKSGFNVLQCIRINIFYLFSNFVSKMLFLINLKTNLTSPALPIYYFDWNEDAGCFAFAHYSNNPLFQHSISEFGKILNYL